MYIYWTDTYQVPPICEKLHMDQNLCDRIKEKAQNEKLGMKQYFATNVIVSNQYWKLMEI